MTPSTKIENDIFQERESFSPDGEWRAYSLLTYVREEDFVSGYQTELTVNQLDGELSWSAFSNLQGAGMGYDVPTVLLWSVENNSLYFTLQASPDGCGHLIQYKSGLYQLDLETGEVTRLLTETSRSFALTQDGLCIAELIWEPAPALLIHDLVNATTNTVSLNTLQGQKSGYSSLTWSPDNQAIALEHATGPCIEGNANYSLLHFDLTTGEESILIWQETPFFSILDWPNPDEIILQDPSDADQQWSVNTVTGERKIVQ
jgi:Tol biopolymer transport system component